MIPRSTSRALALLLATLGVVAPATADEPKATPVDPAARALIEQVVGAYRDLAAYSDRGSLDIDLQPVEGKAQREAPRRGITFARPNKILLDYEVVRLISDGRELTTVVVPRKQYAVSPAPERIDARAVASVQVPGLAPGVLLAGEGGLPVALLLELLAGEDPLKTIVEGTDRIALEPDRVLDGKPVKPVLVDQNQAPDYRMLVDPDTKLLRGVELAYDLDQINARLPENRKIREVSLVWKAGTIAKEVPDDAFTFRPPGDYEKVEPGATPPPESQRMPVEDLVGKPAPEVRLTVLDGPGKTKSLALADLKGKVVLLDFWATWCGPCLAELPEIQKLVDAYAGAGKDLAIIAVSQDDDPADPAELRKLVETTLAGKGLKLTEGPVAKVALDPAHDAGGAYKIEALPSVLLLDKDGVVRSVHVGFSPDVREVLTKEIDALLAGKPVDGNP